MWKWGSEQEAAFRDLKSKLASPTALKPADGTKPFVIRTDANLQDGHYRSNLNLTIDYIPGRSNFIADLLSRPTSEQEKADCDILAVFVDFPTCSPKEVRHEQLKDDEPKKIIECFENNEKSINFANWKNRDLKPRIAILVQNCHDEWEDKLPSICLALNSAKCDTTSETVAYLQFGREIRTIDDVTNDFRTIIDKENFGPEITPYLKGLARISSEVREKIEEKQDQQKTYDKRHRPGLLYQPSDKVWITLHPLSNATHKKTTKFMPKRDRHCIIVTQRSPTTYKVANPNNPHEVLGPYYSSALNPCIDKEATLVMPLRKRGRPRKDNSAGSSLRTIPRNQRGSVTNGNRAPSLGRIDK
ncbi:retrovirus-related Pol polyprotein from transposon 17.6 [Trichonephila clavipes]|nr:retrovirus-related Pol polyprotein from transposon 17.6 [Trichonephila clavipes]